MSSSGVRVGAGPVSVNVGSGRVGVAAGIGPAWVSAGTRVSRTSGLLGSFTGSSSLKYQQANLGEDFTRLREAQRKHSSRRTPLQLRVAAIHAILTDLVPLLSLCERYSLPLFDGWDDGLPADRFRLEATRRLQESGRIRMDPPSIPPELAEREAGELAERALALEKVHRPLHPASRRFGVAQMPTDEDIERTLRAEMKRSNSLLRRIARRRSLRRALDIDAMALRGELETACVQWEQQLSAFLAARQERTTVLINERRAERHGLVVLGDREADLIDKEQEAIRVEWHDTRRLYDDTIRAYRKGDPTVTTIVLQSCFADNGGTAAPLGVDDGDALVAMIFPAADQIVWPEESQGNFGESVKPRTKRDIQYMYEQTINALITATAREAFDVQPMLQRVRIVALDPASRQNGRPLSEMRVLTDALFTRQKLRRPTREMLEARDELIPFMRRWWDAMSSGRDDEISVLASQFIGVCSAPPALRMSSHDVIETGGFDDYFSTAPSKRPTLSRVLGQGSSGTPDVAIDDDLQPDLDQVWPSPDEMHPLTFWIYVGLLAERWDDDTIDLDALRVEAGLRTRLLRG